MTEPGLDVKGLIIRDGAGRAVVSDVSLRVGCGEALVVIGETGSGKSLIAQALLGLLPDGFRASGAVRIAGRPPTDLSDPAALRRHWARDVLLLPQEPRAALDPTMRVGRQLAEVGAPGRPGPEAALAAVDLPPGTGRAYPFALSGGMAQRVLVASALGGTAPVVVVDEPTKGLDAARVGQVIALLRVLLAEGRTLVVITHDPALARGLGGSVAVLRDGRIVEHRPAPALFAAPRHAYTREWLAANPAAWPVCEPCLRMDGLVVAGHGLTFGFPGRPRLFDDLDIHVPRGGVVALAGPSGSGKTTLGNILVGLQPPDAGEITWAGADPYRDKRALNRLRRRYQKLHQDPATAFLPHRPIRRQFGDLAEIVPGLDLAQALPPLLDRLRLRDALLDRCSAEVSGGEAQRLAIARLLLLDPAMIVADEPTSRLDPILQRETILLLRGLAEERGIGLVLISHDRALVRSVADEVVELGSSATSTSRVSAKLQGD